MVIFPLILSRYCGSSVSFCINMFLFNFHMPSTYSPYYLFPSNALMKIHYCTWYSNIRSGTFRPISAVVLVQSLYSTIFLIKNKFTLVLHIITNKQSRSFIGENKNKIRNGYYSCMKTFLCCYHPSCAKTGFILRISRTCSIYSHHYFFFRITLFNWFQFVSFIARKDTIFFPFLCLT